MKIDYITIFNLKERNNNLNRAPVATTSTKLPHKRREVEALNVMKDSTEHLEISTGRLRERSKEETLGNLRIALKLDAHGLQLSHWCYLFYSWEVYA